MIGGIGGYGSFLHRATSHKSGTVHSNSLSKYSSKKEDNYELFAFDMNSRQIKVLTKDMFIAYFPEKRDLKYEKYENWVWKLNMQKVIDLGNAWYLRLPNGIFLFMLKNKTKHDLESYIDYRLNIKKANIV